MSGRGIGEGFEARGGDAVALHEVLAERLRAFKLRGGGRRAEDAQAVGTEIIHHSGGQRLLGPHHGERDLLSQRPVAQCRQIGDGNVLQGVRERGTAIAGGHVDLLNLGRLRKLPGQGVLAAA